MHLSAAEPFANFATGNWSISLRNNTQLTSANAVTAHFNEFEWITTQTTAGHDHVYFGAGVPASNSGANQWIGLGMGALSTSGVNPRGRIGYSASAGQVQITDGGGGRDIQAITGATPVNVFRARGDGRFEMQSGLVAHRTVPGSYPYTILLTDYYVATSTGGSGRSVLLPKASTVGAGHIVTVKDRTGGGSVNNMTVTPDATIPDTIETGVAKALKTNFGVVRLISDGVSNWEILSQIGTFS
jgi:hypothetical protein